MADCTCNNFPANLGKVTFTPNVGIGVDPPGCPLHVVKEHWNGFNEVRFAHPTPGGGASVVFGGAEDNPWGVNGWSWSARPQAQGENKELRLYRLSAAGGPELRMVITTDGKVGIGTPTPESLLHVGNPLDPSANPGITVQCHDTTPDNNSGWVGFKNGTSEKWRMRLGSAGLNNNEPWPGPIAAFPLRFYSTAHPVQGTDVVAFGPTGDIFCKEAIYPGNQTSAYYTADASGNLKMATGVGGGVYVNNVKAINAQGQCLFAP